MIVFYDDASLLTEDVIPYTHVSETEGNIVLDPFWNGENADCVKPVAVKSDPDICDNITLWAKPFQHMTSHGFHDYRIVTRTPRDYQGHGMDYALIIIPE